MEFLRLGYNYRAYAAQARASANNAEIRQGYIKMADDWFQSADVAADTKGG
jgi:hypothetical protein